MAKIKASVKRADIDKALKRLDAYSQEKQTEVKKQVAISAFAIEADAKQVVPVKTGRLRASIDSTFSQNGNSAEVGTDVSYGPSVEFGSSGRVAKPFLFPA